MELKKHKKMEGTDNVLNTPRDITEEEKEKREQKNKRWIIVQQQAFTHWVNETVQQRGMTVNDISVDFKTGIVLINFFELISKKILRERYNHAPKNRIQCINNLHCALTFMERDMLVKNPGCSAEDIIDAEKYGNKLILGLLYTLYRIYRMNPVDLVGSENGKPLREEDALLAWVRQTTEGYAGVNISNFRHSFNDGKAILALCHAYTRLTGENGFDYEEIANKTAEEVLEYGFDFAQKKMGIDRLLEVEEVKEGDIDERALAIYASLFHHAFKTFKELQAMKNELGNASGELQMQMKSKNDLIKMNLDMKKEIEEMIEKKGLMQQELDSLNQQIEEVKGMNENKEKEIEEIERKEKEYKAAIEEYSHKIEELNKKNEELNCKIENLENEHQKDDAKKSILQEELKKLKEELEKLNKEIQVEQELKNGADITSKFEEQSKANKKLEEEVMELEEEMEELDGVSKNLRKNLEDIEKEKNGYGDSINDICKEAENYSGALGILKKQLELHAEDLQRWSGMLEGKSDVGDVESIVMKLKADNEEKSAQERVAIYLAMLQTENEEMEKLYKTKIDEMNGVGEAKKKKPVAKKPAVKK
ncbi:cortexillin II, putative [Entamoeba histolytica KU27]|nr:cortexillin II, putative [Entamoeba histolytica KU27]